MLKVVRLKCGACELSFSLIEAVGFDDEGKLEANENMAEQVRHILRHYCACRGCGRIEDGSKDRKTARITEFETERIP